MFKRQHSVNASSGRQNAASPTSPLPGSSTQSLDRTLASPSGASGKALQSPRSPPETPPPLIPPKNPARSSLHIADDATGGLGTAPSPTSPSPPQRRTKSRRPSTATGATGVGSSNMSLREEVTPWEFQTLGPTSPSKEKERKIHVRDLQMTRITGPSHNGRSSGTNGGTSPDQSPRSFNTAYSPSLSTVSLSSFTAMPPPLISGPHSISSNLSKSRVAQTTATGLVEEVTPWELHPAPNENSTSISQRTTSTDGRMGTTNSKVGQSQPTQRRSTTNTGPVEEVTPWELSPGPDDLTPPPPPSPTKVPPNHTSKSDAKKLKRPVSLAAARSVARSTTYPLFANLPDVPIDLLDAFGGAFGGPGGGVSVGIPPAPVSPSASKKSFSQTSNFSYSESKISLQSYDLRHSKSTKKTSKVGKEQKDTKSVRSVQSDGASVVERTRQLPLTGPLEEVAPWEMHPAPEIEVDEEKEKRKQKIWLGGRGRSASSLNLGLGSKTVSPPIPPSPSLDLLRSQKLVGQSQPGSDLGEYEDGRSMSSSALSVSSIRAPGLGGRLRSNSVAASMEGAYMNGRKAESSASLIPEGKELGDVKSFHATPSAVGLVRGRSLNSALPSLRPGSSGSTIGHGRGTGATSMVPNMNAAQMEEVIPWELCPVPAAPGGVTSDERDRKMSRASTSSTASRALADLGLRRRRSTTGKNIGAGIGRVPSTSGSGPGSVPIPALPSTKTKEFGGAVKGMSNVSASFIATEQPLTLGQTPLPIVPVASSSSTSSAQSRGARGQEKGTQEPTPSSDANLAKFSTADRTILEELKANIRAREAQFVIKGVGHRILGGRKSDGKKHHPYPKDEVPYPRSYDREVVDLDVWETMFSLDLCKGLTSHIFESPPTKVLEIGCGTGTWILHGARTWKSCHFVGLDIVPLHPNLQNVASPDLASRITWVQHNFLDGLPFQNEEFDYVYIKRIALGVPEDKWDKLFEDVHRIMKPGGAFEMVEEDLFFPGKLLDDNDDVSTLNVDDVSILTHETLTPSLNQSKMTSEEKASSNPRLITGDVPQRPPQDTSKMISIHEPTRDNDLANPGTMTTKSTSFFLSMPNSLAPHNPRDHTILEAIWHGMLESRFVNASPLSMLPTYLEYHFKDVRTHPPLLYSFPPVTNNGAEPSDADTPPEINGAASYQTPTSQPPKPSAPHPASARSSDSNDHPDEEARLSAKVSVKHRSLFVALDETRSDALSPSDILHLPKKTKELKPHAATLPNRMLTIDPKSLNLHLALRAKEVIACSEPMWEWVQEYQTRQASNKGRYRSDSIEAALLGSTTTLNGYNHDNLMKNAILEMTRDDFDQMLNNFQLDMQGKACVGHVLEERFSWHTHQSEPHQDRKAFSEACLKYDEWLAGERKHQKNHLSPQSHRMQASQTLSSSTGEDPDSLMPSPKNPSQISRENLISTIPGMTQGDLKLGHSLSATTRIPTQPLPCQQLSRAMRVFVAWKASSP